MLAVTGPHQYEQVVAAVHDAVPPLHDPFVDLVPPEGLRLTPRHYAYLKISEGCNNRCSFCIIPQLRGKLASRPAAHVMAEAERLVQAGVKELLVISQDTSAYGLDIKYAESRWKGRPLKARFLDLCRGAGLARRLGAAALRLSLPACRRRAAADGGGKDPPLSRHPLPARLAARAQGHAPAGAPGEDAGAAARAGARSAPTSACARPSSSASPARRRRTSRLLLDWLKEAKLARVGCFKYEPVDGAAANALAGAVPEEVKEERWHRFMAAQQEVSRELMAAKVGQTIDVIVDEVDEEGAIGRSKWDAPEIDGSVFLNGATGVKPGGRQHRVAQDVFLPGLAVGVGRVEAVHGDIARVDDANTAILR